jgi:segregation and condensation protein A
MQVRELDLDLDAFEGPFDLLLTLVLKEELELADLELAAVVTAFLERLAAQERLDVEACGEFLVLFAGLLELKARALFPGVDDDLAELDEDEAAEELARRLEAYRRIKLAADALAARLAAEGDRFFRLAPAPLAPRPEQRLAPQDPARLAAALRVLAAEPPAVSVAHMERRFPPVAELVERFRGLLRRRRVVDFESEVAGLPRADQVVAFLAVLELAKANELELSQALPFAAIRVRRLDPERTTEWKAALSAS